jgi:hypothetical protein
VLKESFPLGKTLKRVLCIRWTGPYLIVPILFVASLAIESWLQESGVIPYFPLKQRSIFSLWRIVMLTCLVGTPLGTLFMAESWKTGRGDGVSFAGHFFSTITTVLILTTTAMTLVAFGFLVPLGVSVETMSLFIPARCLFAVLWSVAAACVCSAITSGPGGAILSLGLFSLALLPGLSGSSMSWWFIAPLGDMTTSVDAMNSGWHSTLVVLAHSAAYLLAGALILKRTIR